MSSLAQHECQVIAECKDMVRKVEAENAELKKQLDAALQEVERLKSVFLIENPDLQITVAQKRALLIAVDTLVRRPGDCTERTIGEALAYFGLLIRNLTQNKIKVGFVAEDFE